MRFLSTRTNANEVHKNKIKGKRVKHTTTPIEDVKQTNKGK
jgi:hypothetical protein